MKTTLKEHTHRRNTLFVPLDDQISELPPKIPNFVSPLKLKLWQKKAGQRLNTIEENTPEDTPEEANNLINSSGKASP